MCWGGGLQIRPEPGWVGGMVGGWVGGGGGGFGQRSIEDLTLQSTLLCIHCLVPFVISPVLTPPEL